MIVNCTPHTVRFMLHGAGGPVRVIPSSSETARVSEHSGDLYRRIDGIAVHHPPWPGMVEGLPPQRPDVFLLVSRVVFDACPDRLDLLRPGTGPDDDAIRRDGQVYAITRVIGRSS